MLTTNKSEYLNRASSRATISDHSSSLNRGKMCSALTTLQGKTDKRLAIVVPYRNRVAHLQQFIPHVLDYFRHDKIDRNIQFQIHIVEQHGTKAFNRGKLLNCGYSIVRSQCDYVCFHDVDYLPLWADYTYGPTPARLCWHGLRPGEDYAYFFGAVVLFSKENFEMINGFPNCYWGWGWEDVELSLRCKAAGLDIEKRDGFYMGLPHPHAGFSSPGVYSDEAKITHATFDRRRHDIEGHMKIDGLNSLQYSVLGQTSLERDGMKIANGFHHIVELEER